MTGPRLPAATAELTGKTFISQLVSGPFPDGLVVVFTAAAVMMVGGAIASALTGGPTREEA